MLFAAINSGMQQALLVFHTRSRDCRYLEFFIKSTKIVEGFFYMEISNVNFIHLLILTTSSCENCNHASTPWLLSNLRPCDSGAGGALTN